MSEEFQIVANNANAHFSLKLHRGDGMTLLAMNWRNGKRQHMGSLQHNKTIVIDGTQVKAVVFGSTNFTWRGQFVQSNNAIIVRGATAIRPFINAFENYWSNDSAAGFGTTVSTNWHSLGLANIDAHVTFSPHAETNSTLRGVADDIRAAQSSVFYSLAFLNQTGGAVTDAIKDVTLKAGVFVYGISDKKTGGLDVQLPNGKIAPVSTPPHRSQRESHFLQ